MKRIRPHTVLANTTPYCVATVHMTSQPTWTRERRLHKMAQRGLPATQCGKRSTHEVEGLPLCSTHAGMAALRLLMAAEEETA